MSAAITGESCHLTMPENGNMPVGDFGDSRGKVSYSKSRIQADRTAFSDCIKGQKSLRMGQNSSLGAKTQRLREWWLGGWSVSIPEERTACAKVRGSARWSVFQATSECVTAPHPGPGTQESLRKAGSPCFIQGAVSPSALYLGEAGPGWQSAGLH